MTTETNRVSLDLETYHALQDGKRKLKSLMEGKSTLVSYLPILVEIRLPLGSTGRRVIENIDLEEVKKVASTTMAEKLRKCIVRIAEDGKELRNQYEYLKTLKRALTKYELSEEEVVLPKVNWFVRKWVGFRDA